MSFKLGRMKQSLMLAATSTIFAAGLINPAVAAPQDFVGTWVNKNPNTNSITRFVIQPTGSDTLKIQVFGKCHPSDCDWGSTSIVTYGVNVQDPSGHYATGSYNKGFANSLLALSYAGEEVMLQNFTQFLDNSDRQNYYSREYFKRQPQIGIPRPFPLPLPLSIPSR
ncbi:MAG: hypothetical protein KME08_07030 [Aphanothece sp. CMT-3BRIN-NPC111]|jgi:hypothetical protein|nr:hypothetical protein [Aphanothece sp. CMT-3BRIN-NPC111]